ncbi:MAG: HesA/MoeB/ThiF family protein [Desulfurococcales archaeon]|nr:HesA/MoeB/ThiF family protein [Desulfurococcales archaeon]
MTSKLTPEALELLDFERFSRQLGLLGVEGQLSLASSTVAVVGLGGLGSVAALYLAGAGVGRLILVDKDVVESNNLHRQILYTEADIGKPKAVVAAERLKGINGKIRIEAIPEPLDPQLALEIARNSDVIVDALDNWRSRLLVDAAAWREGKPLVHGAAERLYGQATTVKKGVTGCLACIAPPNIEASGCQAILGPVVGILGSIQALEAIKVITGVGEPLYNKLLILDAATPSINIISLKPIDCGLCIDKLKIEERMPEIASIL